MGKAYNMPNWSSWYKKKGYKVEPEIPSISKMLEPNSRVLDIGCGHGRHVIYFARRGHHVCGIDSYKVVLDQLHNGLAKLGLSAELKLGDITKRLPYKGKQFDLILATRSIHHTTSRKFKRILKEINRVIKTDGLLFLQIPAYENSQEVEKEWKEQGKPVTHKWIESRTYVPLSGPEKGVPHHSPDRMELLQFLKGYKIIGIHTNQGHYHGYSVIARRRS